jgi:EAL domain-containing protein (putative c-di-GMP-specific phosphodiesterase class I)/GGDEF domain-containing protein
MSDFRELESETETRGRAGSLTQLSNKLLQGKGPLATLLRADGLHPVYQPIASLKNSSIFAHEALIRGPQGTALQSPTALLKAAAREGLSFEFENACVISQLGRWGTLQNPGRLFVNVSAEVLVRVLRVCGRDALVELVCSLGVLPRMLVLEITEHERVSDMDRLARMVEVVRQAGAALALDDFGDGRSSLRLWSQLKPEFVKIDKYFTKDISQHADKLKTIQALQQIAVVFDTALIAEGIETSQDLRVLRDLGIPYGQGYLLGHPEANSRIQISVEASDVLRDCRVSVFPEHNKISQAGHLRPLAVIHAPIASATTSNDDLAALFVADEQLHALAVVEAGRPIAIVNRTRFMNEYGKLYYREIWGKKSCMIHANTAPRLIERDHNIDELIGILTSDDQRYLADGFIVTDNGRYAGLGTGDQLVRSVTETRIEAARHANPLTFLPGNVPISQHIERLLNSGAEFVACYADLNNFKPFNDQYGYWRGDGMIRLLAQVVLANCNPRTDFVGHVGGDDFIVLFQSADWHDRCERIISELETGALCLFDSQAREAGGIHAEDRHGVSRFFPCTTVSIGAVKVRPGRFVRAEEVASEAALAKHHAKTRLSGNEGDVGKGLFVLGQAVSPETAGR